MNGEGVKHIVLTGNPGVGKTTLIVKLCRALKEKNIEYWGFYTEEIRDSSGVRTGFRVVSTNGDKGTLADIDSKSKIRIGKYGVNVEEFEKIVLPILENSEGKKGVLILDEIGKMELFSDKFIASISQAFVSPRVAILATIPVCKKGDNPISFVEQVRNHKDTLLYQVDLTNRDDLFESILQSLIYESKKREKMCTENLYRA